MTATQLQIPSRKVIVSLPDHGQPAQVTFPEGWTDTLEYDELMWDLMDRGYSPDATSLDTLPDGRVRQLHAGGYWIPPRMAAA